MTRVPLVTVTTRSLVTAVAACAFGATLWSAGVARTQQPTPPPTPAPTMPSTTASQTTGAQASQLLMLTIVDVRPDMMADYTAFQKAETIPALQKAGIEWRDAWRVGVFGHTFTVAFVSPLASFAQLDNPSPIVRALGEEGARDYRAKLAKLVASSRQYALRTRPDLGYRGADSTSTPPKLGVLATVEVAMGRQPEFESTLKAEWAPALRKAGVPSYGVTQVMFGGPIGEYHTFTPIENFAQLDKGHPIQQALGEAALNKLLAKMGPHIVRAERIIIRYDEELSFRTKKTSELR